MRTTDRTFTPALATAGKAETRFFASAVFWVKSVLNGLRNRQALSAIAELDEVHLRDIGLNRRDVDHALETTGLLKDPFTLLPPAPRQRSTFSP
ncbi:hypothetical protein MUU53_01095 [Rhizobium lemnae]|uniref:DUF1127 domain-containing protein n=1 Tax=Rhizobium lemnae TaxID=1214924 RepID=A0ABV8E8V3_9HYPH|nr:hypothetical protein [Rhizobium lemnae]MCJ8506500.1 hypothetical protein [Rhizobium lemnae]